MKTAGTNAQKAERIERHTERMARLKELVADAERYRWLRAGNTEEELSKARRDVEQALYSSQMRVIAELSINYHSPESIDDLIDTARALENRIDIERQCCAPRCEWIGFVKLVTDGGPRCPVCAERTMAVYP